MISNKKGVSVNCTLCHQSESWELNGYGKDFLKNGHNFQSFETMDHLDSDKDGFINSEEWKALSNPGDPASTPKRVGPWLKESKPTISPKKALTPLFPGPVMFQVQEGPLSSTTIQELESLLGRKLSDEEKFSTLFWIFQNGNKSAVASYSLFSAGEEGLNVLLTIVRSGRILKIHPVHLHLKPLTSKSFLEQFTGKSSSELSQVQFVKGREKESKEMVESIRSTVQILERLQK
ncbi:MAG: hypothetical protein HYY07_01785 [Elusimicrobia bacterium]|nr:hypothetical protein [Elusimicrobiota bacterium]